VTALTPQYMSERPVKPRRLRQVIIEKKMERATKTPAQIIIVPSKKGTFVSVSVFAKLSSVAIGIVRSS